MHLALNATFWNQPNTGSGQYTRQLVRQLNRLVSDLEITLVYPQAPGGAAAADVPDGVRIVNVPVRPGHAGKVLFEQRAFPRAVTEVGATIAHVPYWGGPLRSPVPTVVTVHDLTTMLVPEYRRGFGARFYQSLVATSARGAAHVITDSFSSKLDIVDHLGLAEEDVTAIYLGVSEAYRPAPDSLVEMAVRQKYDLPEFYVLYLGGYELHKNVVTLLQAYTYVAQALGREYPLLLAGRRPAAVSGHYPDYAGVIERMHLNDYVRWVGFVDEADKPVLYRNADVFAFPSRYEGFGLPPLEAMACGTPVVASNATSLPEVIGDAGFAIDPDDDRNMAGAIISLILEDDLAAELRRKGPVQAAKFSWETTATETLLVYDRVLQTAV